MTPPLPKVISLDVGGTLGFALGPTITAILAGASKLPDSKVRSILRDTLHVASEITDSLITTLCEALEIDPISFPREYTSPSFRLYPWTLTALKSLSGCAPLVTLSNVSCLDCDSQTWQTRLSDYIVAHYTSCNLGYAKPDARAYETIATKQSVATTTIVHVGDDWECDVLGALSVGAQAFWISRGRPAPSCETQYPGRITVVSDLAEASKRICNSTILAS